MLVRACFKLETVMIFALLQNEDGLMEYFEAVVKETRKEPRKLIGWVTNELLGHLKHHNLSVSKW